MNSQGRIENSIKNSSLGLLSQIMHLISGMILRTVFIHYLSVEYLGVNGLFSNILTVLSLAELGFGNAIIYHLYKPISVNDRIQIAKLMNLYKKAYCVTGCVVAALGLCIIPFLNSFIHGNDNIEQLKLIYGLFLLNTVLSFFFSYKRTIFNADQKQRVLSLVNILYIIIRSLFQIIVLVKYRSFIVYLSVQIICTLLENITVSVYADRCYPFLRKYSNEKMTKQEQKDVFKDVKALLIYKIGGVALNGTDNIIISAFDGLLSVGVLSNYSMITGGIQALITKITGGLTGSIGNYIAKNNRENYEQLLLKITFLHYILYGLLFVVGMAVLTPFVTIWVGEGYTLNFWVVFVFCLNLYIEGMMSPVWTFRSTMGLFVYGKYVPLVTAGINIVISIILAKFLGLIGVLLGTTISRMCVGIWSAPYIVYHYGFMKKVRRYYIKWLSYLLFACMNVLLTYMFSKLIVLTGVAAIVVYGLFATATFFLSVILVHLKSTEQQYAIMIIKRLIHFRMFTDPDQRT